MTAHPTDEGTSKTDDVADPHPSNEEQHDHARPTSGETPARQDLGPNDAIHDGHAPPRPDNAETNP